jgi:adenylate cyclase
LPIDDLHLKGFNHPVLAMEILDWHEEDDEVAKTSAAPTARRRSSST